MTKIPTVMLVVAVALVDRCGRVLLQKRKASARHGGLWEFPGGKVERDEIPQSALVREILEELGVVVAIADLVAEGEVRDEPSRGDPPDPQLVLRLYSCGRWIGEPRCLDAEAIGWFSPVEAATLAVPPLDLPFIVRLDEIVARATCDRA